MEQATGHFECSSPQRRSSTDKTWSTQKASQDLRPSRTYRTSDTLK